MEARGAALAVQEDMVLVRQQTAHSTQPLSTAHSRDASLPHTSVGEQQALRAAASPCAARPLMAPMRQRICACRCPRSRPAHPRLLQHGPLPPQRHAACPLGTPPCSCSALPLALLPPATTPCDCYSAPLLPSRDGALAAGPFACKLPPAHSLGQPAAAGPGPAALVRRSCRPLRLRPACACGHLGRKRAPAGMTWLLRVACVVGLPQ